MEEVTIWDDVEEEKDTPQDGSNLYSSSPIAAPILHYFDEACTMHLSASRASLPLVGDAELGQGRKIYRMSQRGLIKWSHTDCNSVG